MNQLVLVGVGFFASGCFVVGYSIGWRQCSNWRDQLDLEADEIEHRTELLYAVSGKSAAERAP